MFYWLFERRSMLVPALVISLSIIILSTSVFENGIPRRVHREKFVEIEEVKLPENTLLKLYGFPTAVVIPEFSKYAHFRALGYNQYNCEHQKGSDLAERGAFKNMRDKIDKQHAGPKVIVFCK